MVMGGMWRRKGTEVNELCGGVWRGEGWRCGRGEGLCGGVLRVRGGDVESVRGWKWY